jgi:hypothetical protein
MLAAPLWLLGLALLPVIRWLHRGGRHRRSVPVSRLGLWSASDASTPAANARQPPDPAWRRRALLTALLFAALAGPQWPEQRTHITLWVDDSLSMLTRETQGTRLVEGLAQARRDLAEVAHAEVEVRALGDPWHDLGALTDTTAATLAAGAGRQEPSAPPPGLLRRDRLHWLLTDGAHAAIFKWPGDMRADRIVQVGSVTRNVGLERLSARRNPDDASKIDLLLKVTNGGTTVEDRVAVFATDAGEVARSTHRLDPGTSVFVRAVMPASASVRATLEPADALADDDTITLDLGPLRRRRVAVDSNCPRSLVTAVGTHPALALAPERATDADAVLDCGIQKSGSALATLRVLAQRTPTTPTAAVQWSSTVAGSSRIRLDAQQLRLAARLQPRAGDVVLLATGDEPVIVSRAGASKQIETSLDFGSMGSEAGAQIPLLVNLLFERLFGARLLDAIAITDRGPASSRVAPSLPADTAAGTRVPGEARDLRDWALPLLVVAALALLWEIIALGRQWTLLRGYAGMESE